VLRRLINLYNKVDVERIKLKHLALLPAITPALLMLLLIVKYSVNVPVTDQYEFVPIFQSLDHGHIPWGSFWAQHNEHRVVFPNIILVSMARLTHWNIYAEIYLSFITACIGFLGIVGILRRHINDGPLRWAALFLCSAVFFSPVQWENWLWGWQFEWFLCIACIIWTLNLIDRLDPKSKLRRLILPGIIAFVANFSLGSGFLAWIVGLLIMAVKRFRFAQLRAWAIAACMSIGLYYFHYHKPDDGLSSTSFLGDIPHFIKYYLAYLGRPISDDSRVAVFAGFYVLAVFAILVALIMYKKRLAQMIAPISIGLLGLGTGVLTGMARFDYGIAGALSSRYTAFSGLIIIAIIIMAVSLISGWMPKRIKAFKVSFVVILIFTFAFPAILYGWLNGLNGARTRSQLYTYIYNCSRNKNPTQACLYQIYFPDLKVAKDRLDWLKQRDYGGY
jgi:hypothetical protein